MSFYPIDTIKTHLQAQTGSQKLSFSRTMSILYKDEGILRFWKGANVVASGCIPAHSGMFCLYEILKNKMQFNNQ